MTNVLEKKGLWKGKKDGGDGAAMISIICLV